MIGYKGLKEDVYPSFFNCNDCNVMVLVIA